MKTVYLIRPHKGLPVGAAYTCSDREAHVICGSRRPIAEMPKVAAARIEKLDKKRKAEQAKADKAAGLPDVEATAPFKRRMAEVAGAKKMGKGKKTRDYLAAEAAKAEKAAKSGKTTAPTPSGDDDAPESSSK